MNSNSLIYTVDLIDGNLNGPRAISAVHISFDGVCFDRADRNKLSACEYIHERGIYFLCSQNSEDDESRFYVGMTRTGLNRIDTHIADKAKNWFKYCYIFTYGKMIPVSSDVIELIENHYIQRFENNPNFMLDNKVSHKKTYSNTDKAIAGECIKHIDFLIDVFGLFKQKQLKHANDCLFYIKRKNLKAQMMWDIQANHFIVLAGSEITKGFDCEENREIAILDHDEIFNSPSAASSFVIGKSSNGKVEWIDEEGKPLKEYVH